MDKTKPDDKPDTLKDNWKDNKDGTYTNLKTFEYKDSNRVHVVVPGEDMAHNVNLGAFGVTRNLADACALELNRPPAAE